MRSLNIAGTVILMLIIGMLVGITFNTPNGSVSANDTQTVYLEKPGRLTFGNSDNQTLTNINVDLANQNVSVKGNSLVNVNVTTPIKKVVEYKYKTIKVIEYVPVYKLNPGIPVKPTIGNVCMLPGHIDNI